MAMRTFRTIAICAAMLSFGSCGVLQYIFGSVFPTTLMLAKAQADLSGKIDEGLGNNFSVRIVEVAGNSYVVVEGSTPENKKTFFFFDRDLELQRIITLPSTSGNGIMADANGININAGGTWLNPASLSTEGTGDFVSYNGTAGNDGFVASGTNITGFNFQSGAILNYSVGVTQHSSPSLSSSMSDLRIDAVLDDGDSTGYVTFVVSQSNDNEDDATRYFLTILKSKFPSDSLTTGLLDSAHNRDKLERDSFGFADGSVFAYDRGSSRYVRIDPKDASDQDSLYSIRPPDTRFAYRISGGEFYGFDTKSRILTKYTAWW